MSSSSPASRLEQLKAIIGRPRAERGAGAPAEPYLGRDPGSREVARPAECLSHEDLAATLGGTRVDATGDPCLIVDRAYPAATRYGSLMISECAQACDPSSFDVLTRRPTDSGAGGRLLFIDLETTGLAGGAGTHAFLVGLGRFEDGSFHTRQFFLTSFALERALLGAVAASAVSSGTIVSFNGASFDLPLLETRYLFHRMAPAFGGWHHLDMLPAARRFWGWRESCALGALERSRIGVMRHDDVPGYEIPGRYFHYVRTGDARPLGAVLEHNRLDLLSLAALTARALRMVDAGPAGAQDAGECLGLGRLYDRAGLVDRAAACYARVAGLPQHLVADVRAPAHDLQWGKASALPIADDDVGLQMEALRRLGVYLRRQLRHREAAAMWEELLKLGQGRGVIEPADNRRRVGVEGEAIEALAIYHEHRSKDLPAARAFALRALALARDTRREPIRHRLARLDRKLARVGAPPEERADSDRLFDGGPPGSRERRLRMRTNGQ